MSSLNQVQLIGNLGKDPESRRLNNGSSVVSFGLATSETWRDKSSGERKEKTEWHNIVVFNENIGKIVEAHAKKGSKVFVQGKLQTRKWQDHSGADRYTTEVVLQAFDSKLVLLSGKDESKDFSSVSQGKATATSGRPIPFDEAAANLSDDDIPF